jgi:predicted nucleic acid-binding protein
MLKRYDTAWPSPDTCEAAVAVFAQFHLSHGFAIINALICKMAVALDVPLYTFNRKHYAAIPGLKIVQPYSRRTP